MSEEPNIITGVYIRALNAEGQWDSMDIADVSQDTLKEWMATKSTEFLASLVLVLVQIIKDRQ